MRMGAPELYMGMVDVRDVARAHIVVMKNAHAKVRKTLAAAIFTLEKHGAALSSLPKTF